MTFRPRSMCSTRVTPAMETFLSTWKFLVAMTRSCQQTGRMTTRRQADMQMQTRYRKAPAWIGQPRNNSCNKKHSSNHTIPLPKGNTNKTISGNYRGITLSSVFGRLTDVLILLRYSDVLGSRDLQFGFKAKRSTAMCSMVVKEVISYSVM